MTHAIKITRRPNSQNRWTCGQVGGFTFEALVFALHAENPDYELGQSRISKLHITRRGETVYAFDRGLDQAAADPETQERVDALIANLAVLVWGAIAD